MTAKKSEHADQLIDEFKSLVADAETLIKATQDHPGETIGNLRNKALETISGAKEKISSLEGDLTDKAKAVAAGADDFVHRNPWEAIGVAAGLGLLIGLFIRRR
ncbi:YqjD family protein [Polynucleobacter sp. MWH-UH2A]|uniref:DUF883 family protein n=1 Tax=Polynucleobacter sp. MWH-UH2A TaxID=1855617 RepID=UPI001BFDEFF7|nr:DUF883 family protein [Polynucleobacter sp. MWH-UH2A]QWD63204.1 DUF883 domain-containing protein [Polynucleobacter sp. MWH-UH2A]